MNFAWSPVIASAQLTNVMQCHVEAVDYKKPDADDKYVTRVEMKRCRAAPGMR